jgi:DNA polymerase-3 subunit delta'
MAFKDIVGNEGVKRILQKSLKHKKLPNSILFTGPEGIGKTEAALVVAKALNCLKRSSDACEDCAHCHAINHKNFPDVMMLSPAKEVLKIEQMRFLKEMAHLKPMAGRKRVFIVQDAEKMNEEASNSLLKVLEEPPSFSQIILVTPNPYRIIPTIKSRCQAFQFSPIPKEEIQKALIAKGIKPEKARILAQLVNGNLKQALSLEWDEVQMQRKQSWQVFLALLRKEKASPLLRQLSISRGSIKEELEKILKILTTFCRDIILIKEKADTECLMNPDYEKGLREIELSMSLDQALGFLSSVDFALAGFRKNLNVNILLNSIFSHFLEWSHV